MNMKALQSMTAKCMEIEDELGEREGVGLVRGRGCRVGEREGVGLVRERGVGLVRGREVVGLVREREKV